MHQLSLLKRWGSSSGIALVALVSISSDTQFTQKNFPFCHRPRDSFYCFSNSDICSEELWPLETHLNIFEINKELKTSVGLGQNVKQMWSCCATLLQWLNKFLGCGQHMVNLIPITGLVFFSIWNILPLKGPYSMWPAL